jgi:acetylornithine deacetylase/succinyl-diaminopimelate desuccinylase-like protein
MFGRGSQDNKGQLMYFLKAVQTLIENGALNCNLRLFIEGEEESESVGLRMLLPKLRAEARGDVLLVCDTETTEPGTTGITLGLRGVVALEVRLGGLAGEIHSGIYGGMVKNPVTELCRLVSTLHTSDGAIAVPGFLKGLPRITHAMREQLAASAPSRKELVEQTGVPPTGGEHGLASISTEGFFASNAGESSKKHAVFCHLR